MAITTTGAQDRSFQRLIRSIILALSLSFIVRFFSLPSQPLISVSQFISTLFLNALSMSVLPMIVFSMIAGSAKFMQQTSSMKAAASIAIVFALNTLIAALIALFSFNAIEAIFPTAATKQAASVASQGMAPLADMVIKIFPPNIFAALSEQNMLGIISFSLFFGSALGILARKNRQMESVISSADQLVQISLSVVRLFIGLLPYAVLFFILNLGLSFNPAQIKNFSSFLMMFFLATTLYWSVGFLIAYVFMRKSPVALLQLMKVPFITAATTSSSAAALPDLMSVFEKECRMPASFVRFVTPLGTILNMGASSLFICVSVLHLADIYGYPMELTEQLSFMLLSWVMSWGIAGVPSGSLLSLIMLLNVLGIPKESLAMILGFDRVFDLFRTLTNVYGNALSVLFLNHQVKEFQKDSMLDEE